MKQTVISVLVLFQLTLDVSLVLVIRRLAADVESVVIHSTISQQSTGTGSPNVLSNSGDVTIRIGEEKK